MDDYFLFFFSSRRRHTRFDCDWSSDVCSSDLISTRDEQAVQEVLEQTHGGAEAVMECVGTLEAMNMAIHITRPGRRSEEHTSELQSQSNLVCRLLLEKKKRRHHVTLAH